MLGFRQLARKELDFDFQWLLKKCNFGFLLFQYNFLTFCVKNFQNDIHYSEYVQPALWNNIQKDQKHERDVKLPWCAENDELLNYSRGCFANSGQMGHFRSKRGTFSRSPNSVLKIIPAEKLNFSTYEDSFSGP